MGTSRPGQYGNKQDSFFSPHPKHFQEKRFNNTRISRSGSLMLVKWTLFLGAPANRLLLLFNTNQLGVSLFFPRKTHFLPLISLKYVITITRWIYTTSFIYSINDGAVFFLSALIYNPAERIICQNRENTTTARYRLYSTKDIDDDRQ